MPITTQLLPGETSNAISVYDNSSYYDVSLPAKFPLKFYMELNGDKVYLQTRESYNLGKEEDITITIDDTTKVYNPLFPWVPCSLNSAEVKDKGKEQTCAYKGA